ncbi:cytochrome P450 [Streptomyces cinnamoneus]|uniref:Cytochrome P450 n=1 Tax=Streptomyces cinnamoneus TaxID=53446 RepID=A0A918TFN1_STRCJ|nr:cytochrome P450 [Streptomyces cinnamoneus]
MLGDARFSSDRSHPDFPWMRVGEAVFPGFRPSLIEMDPPEHGPARRAVAGEFAIRRIRELRPKVQCIVDGLLDDVLAGAGPADLVSALAVPMSGLVLCELLGIPTSDRQEFTTNTMVLTAHDSVDADRVAESFRSLIAYFDALCAAKMTERPEDLLGRLAGHQLFSGDEGRWAMVELCILLVVAGLETTATMTALGVLALLEHPDQLALLTADPGLTPAAVEELLRFFSVAELPLIRRATADVEIGGTLIREGEGVAALSAAANRDPAAFADPDTFDVTRDNRRHLAFGSGPHQCLGKNLARLELCIVLDTLFRRIPTLRLATPRDELPFVNGSGFSVSALPVTW